jgi:hypothetical protein
MAIRLARVPTPAAFFLKSDASTSKNKKSPLAFARGDFAGQLQLCYIGCLGAFRSLFSLKAH